MAQYAHVCVLSLKQANISEDWLYLDAKQVANRDSCTVCVYMCVNREILKLVASVFFGVGGAVDPDARFSPATAAI